MGFNMNDYNNLNKEYDKVFGAGAYNSGLQSARNAGAMKVQAQFAQADAKKRLSEAKAAAKKAQKASEKKTYDDALAYWNDPANKEHLLNRGVHNIENDYLNDPRAKKAVKESGFNQSDFIDAMYSVASGGSQLSKRGFKQDQKKEKDTVSEKPKKLIPIPKQVTASEKPQSLIPLKSDKKKTESKKSKGLLDDLKAVGKAAYQGFNPFDDVSMEQAVKNYTNRNTSKAFDEVARGSNRAVDSASFGIMSNLDKKVNNRNPYYLSERKFGEGGGTDMITTGLGYLVPGVGAYKALNATKAGIGLTNLGAQSLGKRLLTEGIKGGIVGAGLSSAEVGVREGLNPNDYNWKQNLGYIGQNTALGAIADPLLYGAGKGIQKGFVTASNSTMKSLLPKNEAVANELANAYKQYNSFSGRPNVNVMNDLIPKGNDIANPNYLPNVIPKSKPQVNMPKIGPSLDEILANPIPVPKVKGVIPRPKVNTSEIDSQIEELVRQIDEIKNKPKVKHPYELTREEFEQVQPNGIYTGNSPSPIEAQAWKHDPENDQYLLTNDRVKEDGYGIGTKYEVKEPPGDTVKVYRTVPEGVEIIKPGDYVSTSRKYVEDYLERGWKVDRDHTPPVKILEAEVPKDEITVLAPNELTWTPRDAYQSTLDLAVKQGKITKERAESLIKGKTHDLKAEEDAFVTEKMKPHYEAQQKAAEAQTEWENIVKSAKDQIEHIKGTFGKIYVPKDALEDYPVPKQLLASASDKHSDDIFSFADQMGFGSPDEAVQFLQILDADSKTQLKDLMPENTGVSERDLRYMEESLRKQFRKQNSKEAGEDTTALEQQLNELNQKRETLLNPPSKPVTQSTPKQTEPVIQQETPIQEPLRRPELPPKKPNERSFFNTVQNPEKLSPELQQRLEEFDKTYKPMSNQELVDYANKYVSKDIEKAYQFVKNARKFDSRHVTVGHRLIDELQKAGQFDRALDVVERLAEQGTKAGQSIQSYSIYNRLSAEGQLLRAQRHVNRINQSITDPTKQVKLTPQHVEDITQTADSIQKFAGQMEQASNVMTIMDKVKKGKVATDAELETVRSFVSDAKKFFGDLAPNVTAPKVKPVKDVRTRDKVVDFMSKKEDVARQELRKIFGRANSMPVDAFYHLSVIGASKIAKGTVKLTDFTEDMVKDFGEMVRPYAKQIYNKAVETFNLQSESMTAKRLSEVEKITNKALKDKNIDADQADSIREFARQVGLMSGDAKLEKSMELQSVLQDLERPTFGQKLSAAQTIAQLLNPKTIVRNAIGNEMFYRVEQMNKLLATPVDIVRSKITGGERTITFKANNQGQYWRNWLTGAKAGWKGVNPMGLQTAYDLGPQAFKSKFNPLTYLEKSLGATLRSFDHAGYMRAYNKTLGELASLRAINEGLKGEAKKEAIARYIREADANMMQIADQYGKYATFQDNTKLSTALTKVKKGMNKVSTLGATEEFGLGDLVLKYPKTPGNLIMRALEYSPAGVVRSARMLKQMKSTKDPNITRDFWLSFTRAIMGTGGFSLLGYALADKGILTSAGNSDYEVASLERSAGKQPNSVNISALNRFISSGFNLKSAGTKEGDTFISYDWAQPISIAVSLGTGVNQSVKENGDLSLGGAAKGAFDSGFNTVINQSVLKGVNDFLANYPGRTMSDRIGDAGKGIAGSFVPTLSNQVRQVGDNTTRSTYSPKLLPEIKNRAINRIPGIEKKLPPAYDTLGKKKETYQNGGNNLLNVFLNPSFVSKYKPSPEAKFVLDFINKTGDKTLAPRIAQKKLDGEPLTSKQYSEMQRIMGEEAQKGLSTLRASSDDEKTRKAIEKILRDAGKKAREAIRKERGE